MDLEAKGGRLGHMVPTLVPVIFQANVHVQTNLCNALGSPDILLADIGEQPRGLQRILSDKNLSVPL